MSRPSHIHIIHIRRKDKEPDIRGKLSNIRVRYIKTWQLMAESPFGFPIAIGLYPITLVLEVPRMIAKWANSLKGRPLA